MKGEAWFQDIPDDWSSASVKHLFDIQLGKMLQPERQSPSDRLVKYLKAQHVQWHTVTTTDLPEMWASPKEISQYSVRNGDLLVCEGGEVGRGAVIQGLEEEAIIQNALHRVRSNKNDTRFLEYVLRSVHTSGWFDVLCNKATIAHLTKEKFGAMRIPFPPPEIQKAIAHFLDRKTAAIDTLIAKKQRLIQLLEKKRTVLIDQAVTKGLNPNAPMKDSGIPWIGKIPEHWEVKRLKFISPSQTVGVVVNPSSYVEADGEIPFILGSDISEGKIDVSKARKISRASNQQLEKSILRAGDLVCVRVGEPGITAVVPPELDGINCASVMIVRQSKRFDSDWLCYVMNSFSGRANISIVAYGAAQKQYNISHAVDFQYPFPPSIDEQRSIVARLQQKLKPFYELRARVQTQIEKLQEYRRSLITAAVTGKLNIGEEDAA